VPRGRKPKDVPPAPADTGNGGADREAMVAWMRRRVMEIEEDTKARVELAQTEVLHPNPIYQRLVRHYASVGFKAPLICQLLMMKPSVLSAFYAQDLIIGPAQINLKMAETLMTIGFDPMHPQAATVASKWLERMHPDQAFNPPAQRVEMETNDRSRIIDSSTMTAEQREQVRQIILSASEPPPAEDDPPPPPTGSNTEDSL
jgi:hypothetical protein